MNNKQLLTTIVLIILYAVGAIGSTLGGLDLFHLTPVNLLLSAALLFAFHPTNEKPLLVYAVVVFVCGFLLEWAGVETGRIFGSYFYGENLGVKWFDIPIIIGLNWLLLSYCSSVVAANLLKNRTSNPLWLALAAAGLMLLVDVFIEQVAPRVDFWYWKNNLVPVQNYTAWFVFSFAFNFLFFRLHISTRNPIATILYVLQLLFFVALFFLQ